MRTRSLALLMDLDPGGPAQQVVGVGAKVRRSSAAGKLDGGHRRRGGSGRSAVTVIASNRRTCLPTGGAAAESVICALAGGARKARTTIRPEPILFTDLICRRLTAL